MPVKGCANDSRVLASKKLKTKFMWKGALTVMGSVPAGGSAISSPLGSMKVDTGTGF